MNKEKPVFMVPHLVFLEEKPLNKNSRALLIALLALQDKYIFRANNSRGWFNINNKDLCRMVGIGKVTLHHYRRELMECKWIEYKRGYKGRNSEYMVLIDNLVPVQNKATTKS